jgi:hypothetical protein
MIFRSENYIEGGVRGFFEIFFVADSNQIAVSYCIGSVEFRYNKSSGHGTHFLLWEPKIWIFWFFAIFSKMKKST